MQKRWYLVIIAFIFLIVLIVDLALRTYVIPTFFHDVAIPTAIGIFGGFHLAITTHPAWIAFGIYLSFIAGGVVFVVMFMFIIRKWEGALRWASMRLGRKAGAPTHLPMSAPSASAAPVVTQSQPVVSVSQPAPTQPAVTTTTSAPVAEEKTKEET